MTSTLPSCEVPGCVALATSGRRCSIHAHYGGRPSFQAEKENGPDPSEALARAQEVAGFRHVRARHLLGVERLALPMPGLLDFQFHSANGTILISDQLSAERVADVYVHLLAHLVQQVARFRRRTRRGLWTPGGTDSGEPFAPWSDLDAQRSRGDIVLRAAQRDELAGESPACPTCGAPPGTFAWIYFISEPASWRALAGRAGWVGACTPCREQVAFFLDRCN